MFSEMQLLIDDDVVNITEQFALTMQSIPAVNDLLIMQILGDGWNVTVFLQLSVVDCILGCSMYIYKLCVDSSY